MRLCLLAVDCLTAAVAPVAPVAPPASVTVFTVRSAWSVSLSPSLTAWAQPFAVERFARVIFSWSSAVIRSVQILVPSCFSSAFW